MRGGTLESDLKIGNPLILNETFRLDPNLSIRSFDANFRAMGNFITGFGRSSIPKSISPIFVEDFSDFDVFGFDENIVLQNSFIAEIMEYQNNDFLAVTGLNSPFDDVVSEECIDPAQRLKQFFANGLTIEMCVDLTDIPNPFLSFNLVQFFSDTPSIFHTKEEGAMARVRFEEGSGIDSRLIMGQPEGQIVLNEIQLPENYIGQISIEIFANQGGFFDDLEFEDFVLIDNILIGSGLVKNDSNLESNDFTVCPNPATDLVWFLDETTSIRPFDVEFFDVLGKKVDEIQRSFKKGSIDVSNLSSGIYFYKIDLRNGDNVTGKVFVD